MRTDTACYKQTASAVPVYTHAYLHRVCHACNLLTWLQVIELKVQVPKCHIFLAVTKCDRLDDPPTFSSSAGGSAPAQPAPGEPCQCQIRLLCVVASCDDAVTCMLTLCVPAGNGSQSISSIQDSLLSEASSSHSHESPDGQKQPAEVSVDEIEAFAVQRGAQVFATSAKSGFGVAQLFKAVAEALADSIDPQPPPQPPVLELPVPLLSPLPSRQVSRPTSASTPKSPPRRQPAGACCS